MPQPTEIMTPIDKSLRASACATQHFGAWSIDSQWFAQAMDAIRMGTWKPEPKAFDFEADDDIDDDEPLFERCGSIALIRIQGQMTRGGSSFGGCSTVEARKAVRAAAGDFSISSIMLFVDSPGGTVAGTSDLARDIVAAKQSKTVWAYVDNMGASAAYWITSQADKVYCNDTAMVGSIGTYCVLSDYTGWAEKMGVKYTVVSTGAYKGLGADEKVGDLLVSDVQREINDLNEIFLSAVAAGRGMDMTRIRALADGRVHVGAKALQEGLVDVVGTFDAAMQDLSQERPKQADSKMNREAFDAAAAANSDWVATYRAQGKQAGKAEAHQEEIARMVAISAVCPGRDDLAIKQFVTGADAESTKTIVGFLDADKAKVDAAAKAHSEALAAKDAEIEALKTAQGTRPPVGTAAAAAAKLQEQQAAADAAAKVDPNDPEAKAKAEWTGMSAEAKAEFEDEKSYVQIRKLEMSGRVTSAKTK